MLPKESYRWQFVENIFREEARAFGYKEIRTPVFEHTNLFERGVGSTTDVVQKEMYTFTTKGNDSITLRPEGTAGAARAVLEHGVFNDPLPIKTYYLVSCYRYEKPQSGRQREFHQFGMECYGSMSPAADAEMITAAKSIFDRLQLKNIRLEINSIGCPSCRAQYHKALKEYFSQYKDDLCDDCKDRLERNPMRLLDCKVPHDHELSKNAPVGLDYLCDECREHFEKVKAYLDANDVAYTVNPKIVRGLDYYTKTVFEFICDDIGAQSTVCGGGRYDGLMEELGGNPMPGLGFGMGRVVKVLRSVTQEVHGVDVQAALARLAAQDEQQLLALIVDRHDVYLRHRVQLAYGFGDVEHGRTLDHHAGALPQQQFFKLTYVGLAVAERHHLVASAVAAGRVKEYPVLLGQRGKQLLATAVAHRDALVEQGEVVCGDAAQLFVALHVGGVGKLVGEVAAVNAKASSEVGKVSSLYERCLVACRGL